MNPNDLKAEFSHAYLRAAIQPTTPPAPAEIATYLVQQGWALQTADARWALYAKTQDGEEIVLEVPQKLQRVTMPGLSACS